MWVLLMRVHDPGVKLTPSNDGSRELIASGAKKTKVEVGENKGRKSAEVQIIQVGGQTRPEFGDENSQSSISDGGSAFKAVL